MGKQKEQPKNSKVPPQLQPHVFKKGQSGNPFGRPPGRSLKDRAKAYLSGLTDEEAESFFEGLDKKVVWEMAEGKPHQTEDQKVKVELPKPILDVLQNDSDEEDSVDEEKD